MSTMTRNTLRAVCASSIAAGGLFHLAGLALAEKAGFEGSWWMYAVFLGAAACYLSSAVGILGERRPALFVALLGPPTGGVLIFAGLISPALRFEILIPGTLAGEITPLGFLTLVIEPIASFAALLLLLRPVSHPEGGTE